MSAFNQDMDDQALGWLVRINDPDFDAWEDWDRWMAADPRHAEAYWRFAETEADAVEALKTAPVRPVVRIPRSAAIPRRSAIAAALAAVVVGGLWFGWSQRPQTWTVETAPGDQRTLTLSDGSVVSLDGATQLTLDRRDPRDVVLVSGRALFDVVHDARDPFVVSVGDAVLTDLGTTFDVTRLTDGARVSVSEGIVRVDASGRTATLNAGDGVLVTPAGLERREVAIEDVATWREGRLSYTGETLGVVAEDLSRALERPVEVAPTLAGRRFSGSLGLDADAADQKTRLASLLGVAVIEQGETWRLEPRPAP